MNGGVKPPAGHFLKERITEPTMRNWHSAMYHRSSPSGQATSLYEIIAFAQFGNKPGEFEEIIAIVGITHNNVFSSCRGNATHKRMAIASSSHGDDTSSHTCRNSL